jgi:hypothetical protein
LFYPFGELFSNHNFCQSNAQTCRILDFTLSIDETFQKLVMKPPPSTSTSSHRPWEWTLQNHGSSTERFSSRCMYITSMGTPPVGSYSLSYYELYNSLQTCWSVKAWLTHRLHIARELSHELVYILKRKGTS